MNAKRQETLTLTSSAHDALLWIRNCDIACRMSMENMANDPDGAAKLGVQLQMKQGFRKHGTTYNSTAETVFDWVSSERGRDFATLRRSSLVAACAAFENVAKSFFVEWVEWDSTSVEGALSRRVSLHGDELLLDERDRLFIFADSLYKEAKGKTFSEKLNAFVREVIPKKYNLFATEMEKVASERFDEAFLIRNCIVHRGGNADRRLAAKIGVAEGAEIELSGNRMQGLLGALIGAASALVSRSPVSDVMDS